MPQLAVWLGGLFGGFATWLVTLLGQKVIVKGTYIAAVLALSTVMMAAFNGWISPLVAQLFSTEYGQFLGLAFPPISGSIITSYLGALLAVQVYKLRMRAAAVAASS